jgi:hypothetical protein
MKNKKETMKLKTLILILLPLIATAENWKYVIVDADAPMPWEDLETAAFTTTNWYTNASSSAFLKRDGSLPMMGDFDAGGYDGDNFGTMTTTNFYLKGGSPSTGAVPVSVDNTGLVAWQALPKFQAEAGAGQTYPNSTSTNMYFGTTTAQIGGDWDGTTWTPGVVGWVTLTAQGVWSGAFTGFLQLRFMGVPGNPRHNFYTDGLALNFISSITVYNASTNTGYSMSVFHDGGGGRTPIPFQCFRELYCHDRRLTIC